MRWDYLFSFKVVSLIVFILTVSQVFKHPHASCWSTTIVFRDKSRKRDFTEERKKSPKTNTRTVHIRVYFTYFREKNVSGKVPGQHSFEGETGKRDAQVVFGIGGSQFTAPVQKLLRLNETEEMERETKGWICCYTIIMHRFILPFQRVSRIFSNLHSRDNFCKMNK